jgi:CheY-like chemotaxis protein
MPEPLKILIAEDDPNDLLLLKLAFSKAAVNNPVSVALDGEEVMSYLEGKPPFGDRFRFPQPDLLLLDLKMPRVDGFAVLEWLMWRPALRPRFVVVFTASNNPEDFRRTQLLAADSYLVKPQDPGELVRIVKGLRDYWSETPAVVGHPGPWNSPGCRPPQAA